MAGIILNNETKVGLLYALKSFTELATKDMLLPVKRQREDKTEPKPRSATVYLARLPDMASFEKKAPFILHQAVTGTDEVEKADKGTGLQIHQELKSSCVVRTVFCVYNPNEQEGGLTLLNLMEAMRVSLLLFPQMDKLFRLDLKEGINQMVYPETGERGTAPFYLGEMVTTWMLPPINRLDAERVVHGLPPVDPKATDFTRILTGKGT